MQTFLSALQEAQVELLVDVRAVASSRRPGFSKTKLAANLAGKGIDYLHLRGLGTPADGRAAAHAGRVAEMQAIYAEHLRTDSPTRSSTPGDAPRPIDPAPIFATCVFTWTYADTSGRVWAAFQNGTGVALDRGRRRSGGGFAARTIHENPYVP